MTTTTTKEVNKILKRITEGRDIGDFFVDPVFIVKCW